MRRSIRFLFVGLISFAWTTTLLANGRFFDYRDGPRNDGDVGLQVLDWRLVIGGIVLTMALIELGLWIARRRRNRTSERSVADNPVSDDPNDDETYRF